MSDRYTVADGSGTAHCCFEATVVDTTRPQMIGGKHWERDGVPQYEEVCECLDTKDAEMIASALNKADSS